jgi:hypothetical protein
MSEKMAADADQREDIWTSASRSAPVANIRASEPIRQSHHDRVFVDVVRAIDEERFSGT